MLWLMWSIVRAVLNSRYLFNCGIDPNLENKLFLLQCSFSLLLHSAVTLVMLYLSLPQVFVVILWDLTGWLAP